MKSLLLTIFITSITYAQVTAFKGGEKLTYNVSFQSAGVYSDVAQINMNVSNTKLYGIDYFKFIATAQTYSNFDNVFKIRDGFVTLSNKLSLRPKSHKRSINEGGYKKQVTYNYKNSQKKVYAEIVRKGSVSDPNAKTRKSKTSLGINARMKDVLSALYYIRAISLNQIKSGQKIKLDVIFDAKVNPISLTYRGKKTISTSLGSKICHQFSTSAKGDNNSFSGDIFLTADANKVPVLINANIPVGKAKIQIKSAQGLKN